MAGLIGALGAWPARLVTALPRLTAVPPPRAAWPSPRTLGTLRVACSAAPEAPGQGAKLVRRRRRRRLAAAPGNVPTPYLSSTCRAPQMRKRKRRLDEICLERHPEHSRNVIQSWIAQGAGRRAVAAGRRCLRRRLLQQAMLSFLLCAACCCRRGRDSSAPPPHCRPPAGKVLVNDQPVTKAGAQVSDAASVVIIAEQASAAGVEGCREWAPTTARSKAGHGWLEDWRGSHKGTPQCSCLVALPSGVVRCCCSTALLCIPSPAATIRRPQPKYVCRAGLKLEAALAHWGIDVRGKAALDSGLSTGGFTDCPPQARRRGQRLGCGGSAGGQGTVLARLVAAALLLRQSP